MFTVGPPPADEPCGAWVGILDGWTDIHFLTGLDLLNFLGKATTNRDRVGKNSVKRSGKDF